MARLAGAGCDGGLEAIDIDRDVALGRICNLRDRPFGPHASDVSDQKTLEPAARADT